VPGTEPVRVKACTAALYFISNPSVCYRASPNLAQWETNAIPFSTPAMLLSCHCCAVGRGAGAVVVYLETAIPGEWEQRWSITRPFSTWAVRTVLHFLNDYSNTCTNLKSTCISGRQWAIEGVIKHRRRFHFHEVNYLEIPMTIQTFSLIMIYLFYLKTNLFGWRWLTILVNTISIVSTCAHAHVWTHLHWCGLAS
jgi:hypothetical protein